MAVELLQGITGWWVRLILKERTVKIKKMVERKKKSLARRSLYGNVSSYHFAKAERSLKFKINANLIPRTSWKDQGR